MGKAALDGPGWTPGPLAPATFFCHRPPLAIPGNSGSFPGQSEYAVEVARTWKFKPARGDFSPRSGKGGASAPPQQDIPSYPRVSRPEQFVRSSGSGRETKRELAAASSAGLKPSPSDRPMKATKCGEKSGLILKGYVAFDYGPRRVSVRFHKSLREIADPKGQGSAPAADQRLQREEAAGKVGLHA